MQYVTSAKSLCSSFHEGKNPFFRTPEGPGRANSVKKGKRSASARASGMTGHHSRKQTVSGTAWFAKVGVG